jgi:hypothetical protein
MKPMRNKKRRNLYTPRVFLPVYEDRNIPLPPMRAGGVGHGPITNVPPQSGGGQDFTYEDSSPPLPPHSGKKSKKPYPGVKLLKKLAKERRMEEFRARMETLKIKI